MLRVVHISTTDVTGGAALAAHRLHHALAAQKAKSTMFVAVKSSEDDSVTEFNASVLGSRRMGNLLFRAGRRIQRRVHTADGTLMTLDWSLFGRMAMRQLPSADIIHLHWAVDLLDFRILPRLVQRAPIAWTFHDMHAFTGGCHYDRGCARFTRECGSCPAISSTDPRDVTHRVIQRKVAILRRVPESRMLIVCPSRWMAEEARRSTVFRSFDTEIIPNGIDIQAFRPLDRAELRRKYALSADDRVILFVADKLSDPRKGWLELERALANVMHLPDLCILTLGDDVPEKMNGPRFRHLGRVNDSAEICEAYNLADIFVIPTLQDNFPNTVLESLACGTPVVGFATGGVVDAVEHGVSGLLAPTGDIAGLARHMIHALSDAPLRASMSLAARARAVEYYSLERQAKACAALYRRMLSNAPPASRQNPRELRPQYLPPLTR